MIIQVVSDDSSIYDETAKWSNCISSFSDDSTKRVEDSNVGGGKLPAPGPFWVCFELLNIFSPFFLNSEMKNDDDLPPPYVENPQTPSSMPSGPTLGSPYTIPNIRPSNFVSLIRINESIKGTWLIDPSLSIPSSFLPPRPAKGDRFNLSLESKNGAIEAEVYLLPTSHSSTNLSKFVLIHTQSSNGSVKTRLVKKDFAPLSFFHKA